MNGSENWASKTDPTQSDVTMTTPSIGADKQRNYAVQSSD